MNSSESKLSPQIFQKICRKVVTSEIDFDIGQRKWCMPSSILNDTKSAGKSPDVPSQNNGLNCTNLLAEDFVPRIAEVIKAITICDFLEKNLLKILLDQTHALVQNKTLSQA